jgi:hypothetical protein
MCAMWCLRVVINFVSSCQGGFQCCQLCALGEYSEVGDYQVAFVLHKDCFALDFALHLV